MTDGPITYVLGMDAKIYQGPAGSDLSAMTEMSNVKDVTSTMETGSADISSRATGRWKGKAPAQTECKVEYEMNWLPGDAGFEAVKTAFLTHQPLELCALDGPREVSGSQGVKGRFVITTFNRKEPLAEAITVSVTAELAAPDGTGWYTAP
jgi:hypothetical protein